MQSLKYTIRFIRASFSTALKTFRLRRQWGYMAVGSFVLLLLWFLPLALVVGLIGVRPIGMLLIGLSGIFFLFSLCAWGDITQLPASQEAAFLFIFQDSSDENETQIKNPFSRWADVLVLTLVLPWMRLFAILRKPIKSEMEEPKLWMAAESLLIPVIALENCRINQSIDRVNQIIKQNLLRFRSGLLKIDLVAHLIQWVLSVIGILVGFSAAVMVSDPLDTDPWWRMLGLAVGVFLAWFFITLGILFSTFTRSMYHTALYQWVRNVEDARDSGDPSRAVPPVILREVLGKTSKNFKER